MELTIKYQNGEMCINLENFLNMRNVTKFKKLLKIIDTSYTPEARDILKDYITKRLESINAELKENKPQLVGWHNKCIKDKKFYKKCLDLL